MKRFLAKEHGFVMVTCLALLLMFGILGVSLIETTSNDMEVAGNQLRDLNALYAAEAGAEEGFSAYQAAVATTLKPPSPLPADTFDLERYRVSYVVDTAGPPNTRTITTGTFQGLYGLIQDYDIWGHAYSINTGVQNSVKIRMERALVPIYQFAIFYEDDLEWHPGPVMQLSGRVHANGNLYLGANDGLSIDSWVTSAGELHHGRHPDAGEAVGNGYVRIKDKDGNYQDMYNGDGTWLDNDDADWLDESTDRWGGRVQDVDHGVNRLELPLETTGDAISIIKDASGGNSDSYENKAGLKIIDGQAYFKLGSGTWTNVTATMLAEGSLKAGTFQDDREGKTVVSVDIDIDNLNGSSYWPTNGIIYVKETETPGSLKATRLINGDSLKTGLTVASENPMYIRGDFNTRAKKPTSVMGDAFTILSNAWNDGVSFSGDLDDRDATSTEVNCSFMTGNVPSEDNDYSGGVENFPRFLEKWSGRTLTWRGSMVQMWYSEQATNEWSYGNYYTAPNRNWFFDPMLTHPDSLPPGTPMVNVIGKRGWAQTGGPIALTGE